MSEEVVEGRKRERGGLGDASQIARRGSKGYCRPLLIEVAGFVDDALLQEVIARLRVECARYSPIVRTMFTLVSRPVDEEELFGGTALFTAPRCAVSANKEHAIIARLTRPAECDAATHHACVLETLETFLSYRLLPMALAHNLLRAAVHTGKGERRDEAHAAIAPSIAQTTARDALRWADVEQLVLRHYPHEATRTASFLVADLTTHHAALIDPRDDTAAYEADLARLGCTLHAVIVTHCFVDLRLGLAQLLQRHPHARLVSGLPLQPAGHRQEIALGTHVTLAAVALPSFSPECVVVELRLRQLLLAVFTGPAWSTDAPPRADLYASAAHLLGAATPASVASVYALAQANLKRHLYDAYFAPDFAVSVDHVVVFPSHAGLGHVTHQQDGYWAIPVAAVLRMVHTRALLDALASPTRYAAYVAGLPPLPHPPLFDHVRRGNAQAMSACVQDGDTLATSVVAGLPMAVVDVRGLDAFREWHLSHAMHVPMTAAADALQNAQAELWLQCLLLPQQPVLVVCERECDKDEVRRRVGLVTACDTIVTCTADELRGYAEAGTPCARPPDVVRLQSYEELSGTTDGTHTLVVDVRTPYEFCKGSHPHSVPFPLSELCEMTAQDSLRATSWSLHGTCPARQYGPLAAPSAQLSHDILCHLLHLARCTPGLHAPDSVANVRRVVFYCANGHRSIVAAALLARALATRPGADERENSIAVADVAGGALQIMTQRPDLWQSKDRSIRAGASPTHT